MELIDFIYSEGKNIILASYCIVDNDKTYPKIGRIPVTSGLGSDIFNRYDIPEECQKMFFEVNRIGMKHADPQSGNLYPKKHHRFKGKEFFTDIDFYFAFDMRGSGLFGHPQKYPRNYHVNLCAQSDRKELLDFIEELKERDIYDNYLRAISEISSYRIVTKYSSIRLVKK